MRLCQNTNAFLKTNNPKLLNKKNYSDTGVNHRFSRKIDFPSRGKIKNQRKSTFPTLGKQEISENWLSQHWENKKSAKIGFPNIGKNEKCHWLHFPTLGKTKNPESLLSDFRGSVHFDTSSFFLSFVFHPWMKHCLLLNLLRLPQGYTTLDALCRMKPNLRTGEI